MTNHNPGTLQRVSTYLRAMIDARPSSRRIGNFHVLFDEASPEKYRNYAFPAEEAEPGAEDVRALIELFAANQRLARLEYIPELAPSLESILLELGFTAEGTLPLMMCSSQTLQVPERSTDVVLLLAASHNELEAAAQVQNSAYGAGPATSADIERLRNVVEGGGLVALAQTASGLPIGSGLVSIPIDGVGEVAAVGVAQNYRRRGVGAAITAFLARNAFARGIGMPFLMAAHEPEARIYRRVGFEPFGTMLHISL